MHPKTHRFARLLFACVAMVPLLSTRAFAQAEKQAELERQRGLAKAAEEKRQNDRQKENGLLINIKPEVSTPKRMAEILAPGVPSLLPNTIYVTNNRLVFMYMEPAVTVALPKADRHGHYAWRWDVTGGTSPFSLVLATDAPVNTNDLGDVIKASSVHRCLSSYETVTAKCNVPVEAFVARYPRGFRVEVSDANLVNAVRSTRPSTATNIVFFPLGRTVKSRVQFRYLDQKPAAQK